MIKSGGFGSKIDGLTKNKYLKLLLNILYPPSPFINIIPFNERKLIKEIIFNKNNRILDVGSGLSKGPGDWLWKNIEYKNIEIIKLDIVDGPNIDVVADATDLPKDIGKFDIIILQAVPEHIKDIYKLFDETANVLKDNGHIYIEIPFLQGLHADPNDYWRTTLDGLKFLCSEYTTVKNGISGGVIGTIIWIITDLLSNIFKIKILNIFIRFTTRWILSPFRYLDIILRKTNGSKRLACEFYFLGKKNNSNIK